MIDKDSSAPDWSTGIPSQLGRGRCWTPPSFSDFEGSGPNYDDHFYDTMFADQCPLIGRGPFPWRSEDE